MVRSGEAAPCRKSSSLAFSNAVRTAAAVADFPPRALIAPTTQALATSPAAWPPIPSETAHTPISARSMRASSLCGRTHPACVLHTERNFRLPSCIAQRARLEWQKNVLPRTPYVIAAEKPLIADYFLRRYRRWCDRATLDAQLSRAQSWQNRFNGGPRFWCSRGCRSFRAGSRRLGIQHARGI